MDLSNYWQENKRFLTIVGACVLAFFIGMMVIDAMFGAELAAKRRELGRTQNELREQRFTPADMDVAEEQNEALLAVAATLSEAVEFAGRDEFALTDDQPPPNRYFAVVSRVREELRAAAGRAGMSIPDTLGLPALAPTKDQEIQRHLEALDVIEQALRIGIECGVERVDDIRIKLDSRLVSGRSISDLEKTLIELRLVSAPVPLTRFLVQLQDPRHGRVLLVERAEIQPVRAKNDELRLDVVLSACHLHDLLNVETVGEED